MADRVVMSRLVRREKAGREFDIESWQKLGDEKIFAAAWDLVVTAACIRGASDDQLRLRREIAMLRRGGGTVGEVGRRTGRPPVLLQGEHVERTGSGEEHVLFAVQHEGLGRAGESADL